MPPGPDERERALPRLDRARRLDHDVGALGVGGDRAERRRERAPLLAGADADRAAAGVGDARAEHQPDRPEADDRDGVAALHAGDVDAVEAAGERLGHRGDLGREARRDGEEVRPRDPLGDEQQLGVGAVQEREEVLAERLLPARAGGARAARRRVGGDDAASGRDVDPADLVPERARRRAEQHGVPAAVRLEVGAVGERDLDLERARRRRRARARGRPRGAGRPGRGSRSALTA